MGAGGASRRGPATLRLARRSDEGAAAPSGVVERPQPRCYVSIYFEVRFHLPRHSPRAAFATVIIVY